MVELHSERRYETNVEPGEFQDDHLMPLWYVEYWNPNGHEFGESPTGTWDEATAFVDALLEQYEGETQVWYCINQIE